MKSMMPYGITGLERVKEMQSSVLDCTEDSFYLSEEGTGGLQL